MKPKMCSVIWWCVYGWTLWRLITECQCRSCFVCMFTLSADGGICAECRPAESLLRQRQAGRQADARRELLVVVQLWPWRRLWRTSGCQSTAGGEQGETQIGKADRQWWRLSSACTGNGPMQSRPYVSFRDSWVWLCYHGSDLIRSVAGSWTWLVL